MRIDKKDYKILGIMLAIILVLLVAGLYSYQQKKELIYRDSLDMTAVTVDGVVLSMRDLAYYIAAEEMEIEEQAKIYEPNNTKKYWSVRLSSSKFVKVEAKKIVMETAIHDQIFYSMAKEQDIILNEEEERLVDLASEDFWHDLEEQGQLELGVSQAEIREIMSRIALAEKYQVIYAAVQEADMESYGVEGELYQQILKNHNYKINGRDWKRIPFGNITVQN